MGFLLLAVVVSLLACVNVAVFRSFWGHRVGSVWWGVLIAAWGAGAVLGVWGGFCFEYQPLNELRVAGAPIPAAFFHWEGPRGEEKWVDFLTPAPLLFAGSNVFIVALLAGCPVWLAFWLRRRVLAKPESETADS
jgi:hypothetical protein